MGLVSLDVQFNTADILTPDLLHCCRSFPVQFCSTVTLSIKPKSQWKSQSNAFVFFVGVVLANESMYVTILARVSKVMIGLAVLQWIAQGSGW